MRFHVNASTGASIPQTSAFIFLHFGIIRLIIILSSFTTALGDLGAVVAAVISYTLRFPARDLYLLGVNDYQLTEKDAVSKSVSALLTTVLDKTRLKYSLPFLPLIFSMPIISALHLNNFNIKSSNPMLTITNHPNMFYYFAI